MKFVNSLKLKLLLIMLCIGIIPLVTLALFQMVRFNKIVTQSAITQQTEISATTAKTINAWLEGKVSQLTNTLEAHPEFLEMKFEEINPILKHINESDAEVESVAILNKDGLGLLNDGTMKDFSQRDYFQKTKETKDVFIGNIITSKVTGNEVISVGVPVLDNSKNYQGVIFSQFEVKMLDRLLGDIKVANSGYAFLISPEGNLIFHPNEEWIGKNYKEVVSDKNTQKVFEENILDTAKGLATYRGTSGKEMLAAYETVFKTGWKVVVLAPTNEIYKEANNAKMLTLALILITAFLIIGVAIIVAGFIAKPIREVAKHLDILANADFTTKVPEKFLQRKDEVGLLSKSVNIMSQSIREVLHEVITKTNSVTDNITLSARNLMELSTNVEDVSATTEEMSAGMEETAAASQEMNATSIEIEGAVESIAKKSQDSSVVVEEISKRAQALKETAVNSQKTAHDIRQAIDTEMRASIEQSKAVEQINVLTESILQITDQTNLLALNAAIEAARAGEAGRGFAVVADEIRKLSVDSAKTVNEIKNVVSLVVMAVQNLTQSSEKALNFIDTRVINDYKTLVNTGEQYFQDAEIIESLVTDFSTTAKELETSIQTLIRTISEVAASNNEGAQGTQNIANKSSMVMEKVVEATSLMEKTKYNSQMLIESVSKFKI